MKHRRSVCMSLMLVGTFSALNTPAWSEPPAVPCVWATVSDHPSRAPIIKEFGRLPLTFEPNQGQAESGVRFLTRSADSTLSLTSSEAVFTLPGAEWAQRNAAGIRRGGRQPSGATLRMQLVGADPHAAGLEEQPLAGRANYFTSPDPRQWHTDIPTFGKVGFHAVYPGVNVVYYGNQRRLEYDFVVAPHADPKQIQLHFVGAKGVHRNAAGELVVRTAGRELTWQKPTVYQQGGKGRHPVAARYRLKRLANGEIRVSFALGGYDTARPLVIDPVLTYSSLLPAAYGGLSAVAVDSSGSAYIAGKTLVDEFTGKAFVTKLNPTGTAVVYSTYLGDSSLVPRPALAVDSGGSAYVTFSGAVQKLTPTGAGIAYSFAFNADCASMAVDAGGNAYLTGSVGDALPVTPGAFQPVSKAPALRNAFVAKLNAAGTSLIYATYLGGSLDLSGNQAYTDQGRSIVVDASGNAYVAGITVSSDFPTTSGAYQQVNKAHEGRPTAFVTKLNPTGTALVYSTFLGGSIEDDANGIAVDSGGSAYVTGQTLSGNFPTTPGAFQRVNGAAGGNYTGFVSKLNPSGTDLAYSTYLGGIWQGGNYPSQDIAYGIAVNSNGNAVVTGTTSAPNFPTTIGAFQRANKATPNNNAFVAQLNTTGAGLVYSTLLGGTVQGSYGYGYGDSGLAIALDSQGNAYVAGSTNSTGFPTTPGAYQAAAGGSFVTKLVVVPVMPDFNSDGFTDLLLQNPSTGAIASWFMQGAVRAGGADFSLTPPAEYSLVGTGDFSHNGGTTLVLQSSVTNQIAFWFTGGTNNATISGGHFVSVTPDPGWKVVGIGDFNGDGQSDLVFQNQDSGKIAVWFMDGAVRTGGVLLPYLPAAGWKLVGVGDFNRDGNSDFAFQNQTTGQIVFWYMHGTSYVDGTLLTDVPFSGWKVVGVGDYNGDGTADLLFQNPTSNQAVVWYIQNGVHTGGESLSVPLPNGWKIVGPR